MLEKEKIDDTVMLCVWRALIGEIYAEIIAITIAYDKKINDITIRYYLNREPTDYDEESIDTVADNISDYCTEILHYELEFKHIQSPSVKVEYPEEMELVYIKQGYETHILNGSKVRE